MAGTLSLRFLCFYFFLFVHGFLRRDFTDQHEICLSVVRARTSKTTRLNFAKFSLYVDCRRMKNFLRGS